MIFFSCAWLLLLHPIFGILGSWISKASRHKRETQIEHNVLRFQQPSLDHHYKCIRGGSTYQECNRKFVVKAISKQPLGFEAHASNPKNILDSVKNVLSAFYWFSYPYTMIGIVSQTSFILLS